MTAPDRPAPADVSPWTCARCGAALRGDDVRVHRHPASSWVTLAGALLGVASLFVPSPLPIVFDGTRGSLAGAALVVGLPAVAAGFVASRLPRRRTCACRTCGAVTPIRP